MQVSTKEGRWKEFETTCKNTDPKTILCVVISKTERTSNIRRIGHVTDKQLTYLIHKNIDHPTLKREVLNKPSCKLDKSG